MPRIRANGIELEYEIEGQGEPMVLVMGIGSQLVVWPDGFRRELARRGFRVVVFDNRDVGLSTKFEAAGVPPIRRLLARWALGLPVSAPYSLLDMADDAIGLCDALGFERVHLVGASLGGMVAQTTAIAHPRRLASLTSMMSNAGGGPGMIGSPRAMRMLLQPPPRTRDESIQRHVDFYRTVGSTAFAADWPSIRERAGRAYDRCFHPPGFARQLAAMLATGDRRPALRWVRVPTLVLHGSADPLIPPSGGRATARAIPGARLRVIDGWGHDLPPGAWPVLADLIAEHARTAAN